MKNIEKILKNTKMEKKKIETIKIEVDGELNNPPKKWEKTNFKKIY